jgi:hypothetical protein
MKIIASLHGTAAFRAPPDDITPLKGTIWSEVIAKVATTYKFASFPSVQPGMLPQFSFTFQSGEFVSESESIGIQILFLTNGGIAVQTQTTAQSDLVLESLIALLDESFHFRIKASPRKHDYASHVVVEFEKSVESHIAVLGTITDLVRNAISAPAEQPFSLKKLAFGRENIGPNVRAIQTMFGLDAIDFMDFVIERRAGTPFSQNRYYVGAPLRTEKLYQTLEGIESVLTKRS